MRNQTAMMLKLTGANPKRVCSRQRNKSRKVFISFHIRLKTECFTIYEVNYFTLAVRQIFYFLQQKTGAQCTKKRARNAQKNGRAMHKKRARNAQKNGRAMHAPT